MDGTMMTATLRVAWVDSRLHRVARASSSLPTSKRAHPSRGSSRGWNGFLRSRRVVDPGIACSDTVLRLGLHAAGQVSDTHAAACDASGEPKEDRGKQWRRMRSLLAQAAISACAKPGATRVEWPAGASPGDRTLLLGARVVVADSTGGLEFPHRSIQEYFGAIAVHAELAKGPPPPIRDTPVPASDRASSAWELYDKWHKLKVADYPREAILAVMLSDSASAELLAWALSIANWDPSRVGRKEDELQRVASCVRFADQQQPWATVTPALCDPANDVMRHLTMALLPSRTAPGACDRLVAAIAAGCNAAALCDFLGDCVPLMPPSCATSLACRPLFERATAAFWGVADPTAVLILGHRFWAAADAVTGGAQTGCALDSIRGILAAAPAADDPRAAREMAGRACAAAAVLGSISRMPSPELQADAHAVLERASQAPFPFEMLAAEATFASAVLDPLPGAVAAIGLRERLLNLARPTSRSAATATVRRATAELNLRFVGDAVVHAVLKKDAGRGAPASPFVEACITGAGLRLISPEIACVLFQWLPPSDCTRLAMRMWHPWSSIEDAVSDGRTPLHIAASRLRLDFITVFLGQTDGVDIDAALNAETRGGCTPLSLTGTQAQDGSVAFAAFADCASAFLGADAGWGRPTVGEKHALHAAADGGAVDAVRLLLAAPSANADIINAGDVVRDVCTTWLWRSSVRMWYLLECPRLSERMCRGAGGNCQLMVCRCRTNLRRFTLRPRMVTESSLLLCSLMRELT